MVLADTPEQRAQAAAIRVAVFVEEQQIPLAAEFDLEDLAATHVLALVDERAVGTARTIISGEVARLGRIAVLPNYRRLGIGRALVEFLCTYCRVRGVFRVVLHAQVRALPFYQALGFAVASTVFHEDGLPHCRMERRL